MSTTEAPVVRIQWVTILPYQFEAESEHWRRFEHRLKGYWTPAQDGSMAFVVTCKH